MYNETKLGELNKQTQKEINALQTKNTASPLSEGGFQN